MIFDIDNEEDLRIKEGDTIEEDCLSYIKKIVPGKYVEIGRTTKPNYTTNIRSSERYNEILDSTCTRTILSQSPLNVVLPESNDFENNLFKSPKTIYIDFANTSKCTNLNAESNRVCMYFYRNNSVLENTSLKAKKIILIDTPTLHLPKLINSSLFCEILHMEVPGYERDKFRKFLAGVCCSNRINKELIEYEIDNSALDKILSYIGIDRSICKKLAVHFYDSSQDLSDFSLDLTNPSIKKTIRFKR